MDDFFSLLDSSGDSHRFWKEFAASRRKTSIRWHSFSTLQCLHLDRLNSTSHILRWFLLSSTCFRPFLGNQKRICCWSASHRALITIILSVCRALFEQLSDVSVDARDDVCSPDEWTNYECVQEDQLGFITSSLNKTLLNQCNTVAYAYTPRETKKKNEEIDWDTESLFTNSRKEIGKQQNCTRWEERCVYVWTD